MSKITLNQICTKLEDMTEMNKERFDKIEQNFSNINKKIDIFSERITQLEVKQDTCPARTNYDNDKGIIRSWIFQIITWVLAGAAFVFSGVRFMQK